MEEFKSTRWFKDNVTENEDELLKIAGSANEIINNALSIEIKNPMLTIALYAKIFETICDVIVSKQDEWEYFEVNIADMLKIGYSTTSSEDNEKDGNFMVFIKHLEGGHITTKPLLSSESAVELCTEWNQVNITKDNDILKEIAAAAKTVVSELINIKIESNELIMPIFCIIHSCILTFMRTNLPDSKNGSYELKVAGIYTICIEYNSDGEPEIYYDPEISLKLRFKNDAKATGTKDYE